MARVLELYKKFKVPILYSGGSVVKAFAQMIVGFVIARYISPKDFGLWATINLALTYSLFLQSGLINGLNRELPYLFGKGEDAEAIRMAGTVQTFNLAVSCLVVVVAAIIIMLVPFE